MEVIGRLTLPDECMEELMDVLKKHIQNRKDYESYYPQYKKMASFTGGEWSEERDDNAPAEEHKLKFVEEGICFEFVNFVAQGEGGAYLIISRPWGNGANEE